MVKVHSFFNPQMPKQSKLSSHFDFVVNKQRSLAIVRLPTPVQITLQLPTATVFYSVI